MSQSINQTKPNQKIIYKPSEKSKAVHRAANHCKIIALDGAVRSSKSFTADDLAIRKIQQLPPCDVLISGYSIGSVSRNVIAAWKKIIDPYNLGLFKIVKEGKDEYLKINWRGLRDKKFYIRGGGKSGDDAQIQGATFGFWYGDEMTKHHKAFVEMAMSRLSLSYSFAVWTMNPENPRHYIKVDYLDNKDFFEEDEYGYSVMKRFTFFLEDNPSLSKKVIDYMKRSFSGVFYQRFILSMWVAAEGVIYDFFEETDAYLIDKHDIPDAKYKAVSIDYGTSNPTSFGLYGIDQSGKIKAWRERSYYYDARAQGEENKQKLQKTDSETVEDLEEFVRGERKGKFIIIDPSAASLKAAIRKRQRRANSPLRGWILKDAKNDVKDGIRFQADMLKGGLYKIVRDSSNNQCIKDYYAYMWDPKAQDRGEDKPMKENDHTKDEERYLLMTLFTGSILDYALLNRK